ncbi:hypothetical protein A3G14_04285 [Candidatus Curtissbacteria bacterium RIFCSPLOWO2_12_FULL_38_9]|uniref:Uncharacterized protein n=1 Tax=Candidatus Curtissbacteria bacterium RIFCSPLOWO2_12_FULL_38_9 TaxID=1797735 RepID=A0A1F5ICZ6_9BACT|nr:MAG: hypothetical protein A3G14_04285 [Candidatus Curtissbacteria bacterium RIFCSPLOWO2_12_FULL_38_9]
MVKVPDVQFPSIGIYPNDTVVSNEESLVETNTITETNSSSAFEDSIFDLLLENKSFNSETDEDIELLEREPEKFVSLSKKYSYLIDE